MPLAPGTRLGSYRITALLGSGGMGDVYRAEDPRLEREVAIKVVRAPAAQPDARARLWREARVAAALSHPAICQIYDVGDFGDEIFVVMELLQGRSLADRIADSAVPLAEAVGIALGVLTALDVLHRRELAHRDIKPSNVFLTETGVKLLDFGMARPLIAPAGAVDVTQTSTVVGTPRYMAPEQWSGGAPDPRTDLFATGLVLYEMLTGQPAFAGQDVMEIYHAVMSAQPPALAGSSAIVAVDGVIHRALEKRPGDRYDSASAMAQALRAAVSAGGGATTPMPVRRTTRLAVLPFRILRADPDLDLLSFGLPDAIVSSLADLPSLVVRSPLASAKFSGEAVDLRAVATELAVDAVVHGTLLRAGDRVRVSAQMVEVPSGTIRCSKTVQLAIDDLFTIQDQLARAIVDALAIPLGSGDGRPRAELPATARAYELYLRANHVSFDTSMLPIAEQLYRSALDDDPQFAPAWARLGRVYRVLAKYGPPADAGENLRRAGDAFARAMELNPDSSIAHHLYTAFEVETLGRASAATVRLVERLRRRAPDPELFAGLVASCRYSGLLEASLAADRQARRLDPRIRTSVMYTHFMLGDWERAMASDVEDVRWVTRYALAVLGREDEAIAGYLADEERPLPVTMRRLMRIVRLAVERRRAEVAAEAAWFREGTFDPEGSYFAARGLTRVGETEAALDMLGGIVERGFCCVPIFIRDPWLDPIRATSRFAAIVAAATARSREAEAAFRRAGGDALLGLGV